MFLQGCLLVNLNSEDSPLCKWAQRSTWRIGVLLFVVVTRPNTSRVKVEHTHREAGVDGVRNLGFSPPYGPSSRSLASHRNKHVDGIKTQRQMVGYCRPSHDKLELTFGQAFIPVEYLPALDRGGRDAPILFLVVKNSPSR